MEEPLNLVKLTELMQIERRSRAPISRRTDIYSEVEAAIGSGDIPIEDTTRARQIVRDILFLRKRKIMLLAVDVFNGGQPELKGLTKDEKELLSKAVALLRENDPFNGSPSEPKATAPPPVEERPADPAPVPVAEPAQEAPAEPVPEQAPVEAPDPGHVILRALEKIDFVSLERTYMVDTDDVFTVDSGTADILTRAGKAVRVASGDAE